MAAKGKAIDKNEWRELRNTVYTFFYYSNKPIGTTELILQFKNQRKGDIESVLNDLAEKGKIMCKSFSKSRVYYLTQDMEYSIDDPEYTDEVDSTQSQTEENKVLRYLQWKNGQASAELKALQSECAELDSKLTMLDVEMTAAELRKANEAYEAEIAKYSGANKGASVDPAAFEKLKKHLTALQKMSTERTRMFRSMAGSISEGLEIKTKDLLEEAGIEQ